MDFEQINKNNLQELTHLMISLWPDCDFEEELLNCQKILSATDETSFLVKDQGTYIGFIQLSIRTDYVEGAEPGPVAYIEGIYLDAAYRKSGIGKTLVQMGEDWGKEKGCRQYASDVELHNVNSIDFHKKIGFEEVNRVVCFFKEIE